VEGMLANAKSGGLLQPTENPVSLFTQQLERAEKDPAVKAVVLRMNSPGGTVSSADAMFEQIMRFRQRTHKPVVASFQEVAASGAYYIACGTDRIVAQPTSVVGSIGVVFYTFNISGTLSKIGASAEALKSGPLKDMGSPLKPLTAQERTVMQGLIDEYYARFVDVVAKHRPIADPMAMKTITDGRVFSGRQAKDLGLVDELGLLEDAITTTRKLAHAPKAKVIMYKRPYGYGGSIYASAEIPQPQANVTQLQIPGANHFIPAGFYYLWNP
jgi:protease IV